MGVWKLCFILLVCSKSIPVLEKKDGEVRVNTHKSGKAEVIEICLYKCVILRAAVCRMPTTFVLLGQIQSLEFAKTKGTKDIECSSASIYVSKIC